MSVRAKADGNGAAIGHGTAHPNQNADYTHTMLVKPDIPDEDGRWVTVHELIETIDNVTLYGDAHDVTFFSRDIIDVGPVFNTYINVETMNNAGTGVGEFDGTYDNGEWYFLATVRRGNDLELWSSIADGVSEPQLVKKVTQSIVGRHAAARLWVGAFSYVNQFFLMQYMSVTGRKLWQASLSATELRKESKQKHPVKTTDRWAHWLTKHKDDLADYSGNGRPWNWAKDAAQTPVDTDDEDIETDPDDSPIPDGEIGQDPEAIVVTPTTRPGKSGRLTALKII